MNVGNTKGRFPLPLFALIGVLLFVFQSSQAQIPFICDGRFYMTQVVGTRTQLVEVDIDPNTQEVVFNEIRTNIPNIINAIGYRAEENLIYGIEPQEHDLFRIDALGTVEKLADLDLTTGFFYLGADITPDGRFLVLVGSTDVQGVPLDDELAFVDLEDPSYSVSIVKLKGALVNMLDVAFDPTNDVLYGFDSGGNRLVTIDPDGTVNADFPPSPLLENAGSLFFDIFGDLYAYGSPEGGLQNTLYSVDKNTGEFGILTTGDLARATDACSCPFSVEVRKLVDPEITLPCGRVKYSFAIANQSTRDQGGIMLEDLLPSGFTILSILNNPFGGTVQSGPGTDLLQITDMVIPPGKDTLVIEVELDDLPPGVYKNQATLYGLPVGLGETRISDDPRTLTKRDSTTLIVTALNFDSMTVEDRVCLGQEISLDATAYGSTFRWLDDPTITTGERFVGQPGMYTVEASTPCDTVFITYDVESSDIDVSVFASDTEILLGDTVRLSSVVTLSDTGVVYQWLDPLGGSLTCINCPDPLAIPFDEEVTYTLQVQNSDGCIDEAEVTILVDFTRTFYAPNVFSPNGDGANDIFYLQGFGLGQIERFEIYNRWGGVVYRAPIGGLINEATYGWNGTINGKQADLGVYVWVARISYLDGTSEVYSGDVTLLR